MNKWSFKRIEKLTYLLSMSGLALGGGWMIYRKNVLQAEERAEQVSKVENKYLKKN